MQNARRIIGGTAARQVLSGVVTVATLAFAAKFVSPAEYASFAATSVFVTLVASVAGLPFYPAIYKSLSGWNQGVWQVGRSLLPLVGFAAVVSAATILFWPFEVTFRAAAATFSAAVLLASALPAFALGTQSYRLYNVCELIPAFLSAFLVIIRPPASGESLLWYMVAGFAAKISVYGVWFAREPVGQSNVGRVGTWSVLRTGSEIGLAGAAQGVGMRVAFMVIHAFLPMPIANMFAASWPFAEKILVLPQAVSAVMFGVLNRRSKNSSHASIYLAAGVVLVATGGGAVLLGFVMESLYFSSDYHGFGSAMVLAVSLCLLQGGRVLASSLLTAVGQERRVIGDSFVVIALACVVHFALAGLRYEWKTSFVLAAMAMSAVLLIATAIRRMRAMEECNP